MKFFFSFITSVLLIIGLAPSAFAAKGAALNAVEIAEALIEKDFYGR